MKNSHDNESVQALRAEIEAKYSQFDEILNQFALKYGFEFHSKCGPSRGRALSLMKGKLRKMLCLDSSSSLLETDPSDFAVDLTWACWLKIEGSGSYWLLRKAIYSSPVNALLGKFSLLVTAAMEELDGITPAEVESRGEYCVGSKKSVD